MTSTFHRLAALGVFGMGLCLAGSALAQDRAGGPGGPPPGARGDEHRKMFENMEHRREQRLHDLLQIKPEQEAAFRTFVSGLEAARSERGKGPGQAGARPEEPKPLTTPERLDRAAQRLTEAQARLQKTSVVIKTFYAALTADQRKAFDAMPMPFGGERGGHGPRMMMMMRGPGRDGAPQGGPPPR